MGLVLCHSIIGRYLQKFIDREDLESILAMGR